MIGSRIQYLAVASLAALAGQACAQGTLYGLQFSGALSSIDLATGAATFIGMSGGPRWNAAAADSQGRIWACNFDGSPSASELYTVDPATGVATLVTTLTGVSPGHTVRGMAFDANDRLYVTLDMSIADSLGTVDTATGQFTMIGPTGRTDIQGLGFDPQGGLWAVSVIADVISRIDIGTGLATVVGGSGISGDNQALEFDDAGNMYVLRVNLKRVDPATGNATLIGRSGVDYRGMAFVNPGPPPCYPDCDTSTGVGVLDIFDFLCFDNAFNAGCP